MTLGPWGDAALGAREVLLKALRRSAAETREAVAAGVTDRAAPFRLGDLSRAQWFLWTGANLAATERAGRAGPAGGTPRGVPSLRTLVLATLAADLYLGYTTLRERERWLPATVGDGVAVGAGVGVAVGVGDGLAVGAGVTAGVGAGVGVGDPDGGGGSKTGDTPGTQSWLSPTVRRSTEPSGSLTKTLWDVGKGRVGVLRTR